MRAGLGTDRQVTVGHHVIGGLLGFIGAGYSGYGLFGVRVIRGTSPIIPASPIIPDHDALLAR